MATSVDGSALGFGADYIVLDDPTKPEEAASDTRRQATNNWFSQSVVTRLNDKRRGRIILIMQRLHEDDMTGHVLGQGGWTHLSLPAIAQADETHAMVTPFGLLRHERREGEALHPEREPIEQLAKLRTSMGSAFFSAQYLQSPTPPGGGIVKIDWFPRFNLEQPPAFERIVQSWDTAISAKELSSYSVCTTWGILDRKAFLIHVLRKRMEFPELRSAIVSQASARGASTVLIEEAASGASLLQDLRKDLSTVRGCKPVGDKVMRMNAQTVHIENGLVYFPKEAPWLPELEHELMMFPNGSYDDQVDSISQAMEFISKRSDMDSFIGFTRLDMARRGVGVGDDVDGEPRTVRAISNTPSMNIEIKTNSGRLVGPDANGFYWLTKSEADGLRLMPGITILPD
jgi:predicted phage terminase large subunit-like protein